jgi:hypothetical protein
MFHNDFSLYMMPLRSLKTEWKVQYQSALECWMEVWRPIHQKFHASHPFCIDGFLRQDEGAFLFYKEKCMGLALFRTIDFGLLDFSLDSYFNEWPTPVVSDLRGLDQKVFIGNNLTVDPEFRNFHPQLKFKQFFMNVMVRRFRQSGAACTIITGRRDRGVGDEGLKRGGKVLAENVAIFNGLEHVDLVHFSQDQMRESRESLFFSNFN